MDGSSLSLIVIPIVVTMSLAVWLIMVAYAVRHPEWRHAPGRSSSGPATPATQYRPEAGAANLAGAAVNGSRQGTKARGVLTPGPVVPPPPTAEHSMGPTPIAAAARHDRGMRTRGARDGPRQRPPVPPGGRSSRP